MADSLTKIKLKTVQPSHEIDSLAEFFEVDVQTDCDEHVVQLPKKFGSVTVNGVDFYDGYGLLIWSGTLEQDILLKYKPGKRQPLRFLFCLEGELTHFINDRNIQYQLNPLLGSITTSPAKTTESIRLPGGMDIHFCSLVIRREDFLNKVECNLETIPDQLARIFRDTDSDQSFFYEASYSVACAECIKKIYNTSYEGLVRMTYLESKALELLTFQLKQYMDDQKPTKRQVLLRKFDVEKIIEAKDYITSNLRDSPSIKHLAHVVGINENKLKRGFKLIFNQTINQYLRNEKLELAKLLLMEERSVSEVAELVGYQNKSHFSKRFKEKYGVLPKGFVKKTQTQVKEALEEE